MKKFHLHLVSDATGETLRGVAKAILVQFPDLQAVEHIYPMVRTSKQVDTLMKEVRQNPGIVLSTTAHMEVRQALDAACQAAHLPHVAVLEPVLATFMAYLQTESLGRPGEQYRMDQSYFDRIDAMNYTLAHDDGQLAEDLPQADVVLVGVSRTSKTPTSIYLANRGLKVANVPLVPGRPLPAELDGLTRPLVVGLTASDDRLMQIRRTRMGTLGEVSASDYTNLDKIEEEVAQARRLFAKNKWPVIDVTRRSIEETAAAIYNLYLRRRDAASDADG